LCRACFVAASTPPSFELPHNRVAARGAASVLTTNGGHSMRVGFIGLGNVGGKLAGNLARNGVDLVVRDLDRRVAEPFIARGAAFADSPAALAQQVDVVITCLPSPAASAAVLEAEDGVLSGLVPGKIWVEMSTTDAREVVRLAERVVALGADAMDCPVSGGCHRAATGNISILAGGDRRVFERLLPLLTVLGRRVLHTGALGSASRLKVLTNYLATANLVSLTEALATAAAAGMDLATTYEAIRISSGNSFVHETESQVILNGSRNINFTMELVLKDIGLFQEIADEAGLPLELSPLLVRIFRDGMARYGGGEWSPNIIRRLEEACDLDVRAPGFPAEIVDDEPEAAGHEVSVGRD
jgi:3-hydroxyisobutyrate dehydrogenase